MRLKRVVLLNRHQDLYFRVTAQSIYPYGIRLYDDCRQYFNQDGSVIGYEKWEGDRLFYI